MKHSCWSAFTRARGRWLGGWSSPETGPTTSPRTRPRSVSARLRGGTWDVTPERLEAYVATIVWRRRSLMLSQRRKAAARDWTYLREIAASTRAWMDPETQWQERELTALYNTTLESLPPRCRQAFIAVREHDQSYAEAARTLGVSEKMIAKLITQAQRVFRVALRARGIRVPPEEEGGDSTDRVRESPNGRR